METETTFSEATMDCMEQVRQDGACNMLDGACVADAADFICQRDASDEVWRSAHRRRGTYGKLLAAFSAWKAAN